MSLNVIHWKTFFYLCLRSAFSLMFINIQVQDGKTFTCSAVAQLLSFILLVLIINCQLFVMSTFDFGPEAAESGFPLPLCMPDPWRFLPSVLF